MTPDPLLGAKLRAILLAFREELKPELSSPNAKLRGELVDMMLTRLAVEADGGDGGAGFDRDQVAALAPLAAVPVVAAAERDRRVALEDQVAAMARSLPATRSSAGELAVPPDTFTTYLRARFPNDPDIRAESVNIVPGGRSKATILVDYASGEGPRQIVVRKDFELRVTGTSVVYEYPVVRAAFEAGLNVPEPLWLEEDPAPVGGPFIAFRRVAGKAMGTLFSSDATPAFVREFAGALARLHRLDVDAAGIGDHLRYGREASPVAAMLADFHARYRRDLTPNPLMNAAFAWLDSQLGEIGTARALVHGDAGLHNTLGEGDRLTALLDWEFSHAGDPAEDLTYCKYLVERILPWDEFMAAYEAAGGERISEARMRFFTIWRTLHLSILTGAAGEAFARGADRDLRLAAIGFNTFPKQLKDLAVDLAAATGAAGG